MNYFNCIKYFGFAFMFIFQSMIAEDRSGIKALSADDIALKSFGLPRPKSLQMQVVLTLINSKGNKRKRNITMYQKEFGDETMEYVHFLLPKDVAGTKFLSRTRNQRTETRMFTPSDSKVRVIGSSSKGNSFMGTDFSYYDLEHRDYKDFHFRLLESNQTISDKAFKGILFYKLKAIPVDEKAPYASIIYWIDRETFQARRIEAYEGVNKVKDIYILQNVNSEKYFLPKTLLAINYAKNGHRTLWQAQQVVIDPELDSSYFQIQNLR